MALTLQALKTEIVNDPQDLGYDGKSDSEVADILNLVRAGITVRRADIMPNEVLEAIDSRDFVANPNPSHVAWFESVTQLRVMRLENDDGTPTRIRANLNRLLESADTQGSRARLQTITTRSGSRAEQLFGRDTVITASDVANAKELP